MQENLGETSGAIIHSRPVGESQIEEGKTRPPERHRIQPDEARATHRRLCHSCQALKLDDQSFGAPAGSFGNTCTSPFPEYLDEDEEKDGLTVKFIPLNYTREDALPDLPTLSQSERDGCGVCALLAIAARREYYSRDWPTDSLETPQLIISGAKYAWQAEYGPTCLGIRIIFRSGDEEVCSMTIPFQISCSEGECATWLKTRYRPLEHNPLSEKTGTILRSWLRQCHDSHEECHHEGSNGRLPTRLLDVGGSTLAEEPRLILCADDLELRTAIDTPYAALSHCWGQGSRPPKTETFSISHRLQEIPLHSMPPTYRDAIMLTRSLHIRYLWIDSLCIIQDDKADWERESTVMFDVYRNAHITLCALVNSCDDGFLSQLRQEVEIPFRSSLNPQCCGTLSLREVWPHDRLARWHDRVHDWKRQFSFCEWNNRGWTFQELLFSPRKLICGLQQFHYDCDTMHCSEDDTIQTRNYVESMVHSLNSFGVPKLYKDWYATLPQYVDRSLTFAHDRLPAVSSLAAAFAERTKDRFIAGIWEADLPRGLWWESSVQSPQDPHSLTDLIKRLTNLEVFVAPSWSWACLQTYKEWRQWVTYVSRFQLIEAHTQVDGDNQFGRVAKAHLIIIGKLLHIQDFSLRDSGIWGDYTVTSSGSFIANWRLDWALTDEELADGLTRERNGPIEKVRIFMLLICSIPAVEDVGEPTLEDFNKWCTDRSKVPGELQVGLVLCSLAGKDEYMRIGRFETVDWEEGGRKLFESVPEREIKLV